MKSNIHIIYKTSIITFIYLLVFYDSALAEYIWTTPEPITIINTKKDDFAPSWNSYQQLLYFNSDISGFSYFYYTELIDQKEWTKPILLNSELNKKSNNQSFISFYSQDTAYLTTYRLSNRRSYMNIFRSINKKNNWTKPVIEDSLFADCFVGHPTISPDGEFMIFASNRLNNKEETDLWIAFRIGHVWGNVRNLSEYSYPDINTEGNEITPFLVSPDTLYFASDGYHGRDDSRDFDLFITVRRAGIWQKPYPISMINSIYDESDLIVVPDKNLVVFSSNRPGGKGGLDLYFSNIVESNNQIQNAIADIKIGTLVDVVEARAYCKYMNYPVFNNFYYDNRLLDLLNVNSLVNKAYLSSNIDSAYYNSIPTIGKRLQDNNHINITISLINAEKSKNDNCNVLINRLKEFLVNNYYIEANRINVNTNSIINNNYEESYINIESNDNSLFDTQSMITKIDSIIINPSMLDVFLDIRTNNQIQELACYLKLNKLYQTIKKDTVIDKNFSVDLSRFSNEIFNSDSLLLSIELLLDNGITTKTRELSITHPYLKELEYTAINQKYYEQFFIPIQIIEDTGNNLLLKDFISEIKTKYNKSKSIIIEYYNEKNQVASSIIKTKLLKEINTIKKDDIEIKKNSSIKPSSEYKKMDFYIQILVEK